MKFRQLINRVLVTMVLLCCCQQICVGLVVKAGISKNSTNTTKEVTPTPKHLKVIHKAKITTTKKPDVETTILPNDLDVGGRTAFINNQYITNAEEESIQDKSSPLYEILQQQMETVLSEAERKMEVYTNNSPQIKDITAEGDEKQKISGKPIFSYNLDQFGEYDEEGNSDYSTDGEYILDNFEDTQETSTANDDNNSYSESESLINSKQQNLQNTYGQESLDYMFEQKPQNKLHDSSNYGPQTNTQRISTSYGSSSPQNSYGNKRPMQHNNNHNKSAQKTAESKPKPLNHHSNLNIYDQSIKASEEYNENLEFSPNNYGHLKPAEYYNQNSYEQSNKQQQIQKPQHNQNSFNIQKIPTKFITQQFKSGHATVNQKLSYADINPQIATIRHKASINSQNYSNGSFNSYGNSFPLTISLNPFLYSNSLYGNTNTENSSPFSTTLFQRRHLTFQTVASSTQYVSSPLADFMLKFSIGMAKPINTHSSPEF